jgi:hypothetical protein
VVTFLDSSELLWRVTTNQDAFNEQTVDALVTWRMQQSDFSQISRAGCKCEEDSLQQSNGSIYKIEETPLCSTFKVILGRSQAHWNDCEKCP